MRLSIQRLRWVLLAGALLLIVVLAAYISYSRYRALKTYRQIIARSGATLTHDSNGVTYSQSVKGRKVFTIRAKTESSLGNGKWALHDAEMLLYSRSGDNPDHIYGSQMEYDQNEGIARAEGEVFMDLQPPQGLTNGGRTTAGSSSSTNAEHPAHARAKPESAQVIHVRTSGLVYLRKLGIAATSQPIQFSYGDMQCTAVGATFNSDQNVLRLLADVHLEGLAHGQPLHITATSADMNRNTNVAHLTHPVVTSDGRSARSDLAVVDLRKDGSIERVQGIDHVVIDSATQQITANRLDAMLDLQSIPQAARLSGDVVLVDADPVKPMHGSANVLDAVFNAEGAPTNVVATGAVQLSMVDHGTNPRGLSRSIDGAKIDASFVPGKHKSSSQIKEIHAMGSAHAGGESIATSAKNSVIERNAPFPLKNVQVWADDLRVLFTATSDGRAQPQKLYGSGQTRLQQDAPLGEQETSSGDILEMAFGPAAIPKAATTAQKGAFNIISAVQTGHVTIHDRAAGQVGSTESGSISTGTSDRAAYDGPTEELTLTGNAHLYSDNASLRANTVSLDQRTQDAEANGGVQATFQNAASNAASGSTTASTKLTVTHVLSTSAHFEHATQLATFYGTDAQPARMWQDASQVQAATLLFDGIKRTFSARPAKPGTLIHAIFASSPPPPKRDRSPQAASIIRVSSQKMDYNDLQREAAFSGGVTIDGSMGKVRGHHAVVFLVAPTKPSPTAKQPDKQSAALEAQPSPLNGSIDRVVVDGAVDMEQPGRRGAGEHLVYTVATGNYMLTGTPTAPPRIVDAQQGNVTGARLFFTGAGSTIVVAGDSSAPKGKGRRVRTETYVSPAKEERQ